MKQDVKTYRHIYGQSTTLSDDDFSFDFFDTGSIGSIGGRTFNRGSSGTSERDLPERDDLCFVDISACDSITCRGTTFRSARKAFSV